MDQETIAALIDKYYAGETTIEEESLLEGHYANAKYQDPTDPTEAIFHYAHARRAETPPVTLTEKINNLPLKRSSSTTVWWAAAAAVTIMIGASWLMYPYFNSTEVRLEASDIHDTVLPDGTHVWMNAGTRLTYEHGNSDDLREVTLQGEAYFEVAKDKERPRFVIHTGQATTTVTGTAFNLRNIDGESFIELSVLSGTVLFGQASVDQVTAGMQALFDRQTGKSKTTPLLTENAIAWKDHKLSFTNVALSEVILDIERYFQVNVELKNPDAASCHLTGEFINPDLEDMLDIITQTLRGSHYLENNTYYINIMPCDQ